MKIALTIQVKAFDDLSNSKSELKPFMKNFEFGIEKQKDYLFFSYSFSDVNLDEIVLLLKKELKPENYNLHYYDNHYYKCGLLKDSFNLAQTNERITFDTGYKMLYRPVWVPTANKIGIVMEENKEFVSIKFAPGRPWVKIGMEHVVPLTEMWKNF